jgi:phospholipase C
MTTRNTKKLAHRWPALLALASLASNLHAGQPNKAADEHLKKIEHIIVIYQENWSFDSLYGQFPGVDGLQNAFDNLPQFDIFGAPIYVTPQPLNGGADNRFPPGNVSRHCR